MKLYWRKITAVLKFQISHNLWAFKSFIISLKTIIQTLLFVWDTTPTELYQYDNTTV